MYDIVTFFDEMNILQSDKDRRIKAAGKFKDILSDIFIRMFFDLLAGLLSEHRTEYETEITDLYLSLATDPYNADYINKAYRFSGYILDATDRAIRGAEGNDNYKLSVQSGVRMRKDDVPKTVLKMFAAERALEAALNEVNWIFNYDNHKKLVDSGQLTHTWVSMRDERVRKTHWEADGQTVPINEPFIVGGYQFRFPMDDLYNPPLELIMNCRCVEI